MGQINLTNSQGRDAQVLTRTVTVPLKVRWVDEDGRQAENKRILRATVDRDMDALVHLAGSLEKVADLLIQGDPEIDPEIYGSYLGKTSRVYVDFAGKVVHRVRNWEIVKAPDGSEKERRPLVKSEPNVAGEVPLRWSGKLMKKSRVFNRFVFSRKMQITHFNGLTYDFLFEMAKGLEDAQSLMLVGAGSKANKPLVFARGGTAYRGFLEGRTRGKEYALILHLSNLELKAPPLPTEEASS